MPALAILDLIRQIVTVAGAIARAGGDAEAALRVALEGLRRDLSALDAIEGSEDAWLDGLRGSGAP